MNRILYENRCKCRTKKRKLTSISEGKPLQYPEHDETEDIEILSKTFQIKYQKKLSSTAKFILNSFQNKYIYYAIDDILYAFKFNTFERDDLLTILYSPLISLQNNFAINFFDVWISEIYIEEISKVNKFLKTNLQTSQTSYYITIILSYKPAVPIQRQETLW